MTSECLQCLAGTIGTIQVCRPDKHWPTIRHHRVYFLAGPTLNRASVEQLCRTMLADPVTETALINPPPASFPYAEITLLPGETDSVAESLLRSAHDSGVDSLRAAASGAHVTFAAGTEASSVACEVSGHLANVVIPGFSKPFPEQGGQFASCITRSAPG